VIDSSDPARRVVQAGPGTDAFEAESFPAWFTEFLHDRQTRKPSAHTMKAYRQDFAAIASLVTGGDPAGMNLVDITKNSMRAAFCSIRTFCAAFPGLVATGSCGPAPSSPPRWAACTPQSTPGRSPRAKRGSMPCSMRPLTPCRASPSQRSGCDVQTPAVGQPATASS
jgi:hypothetical protein